MTTQQKRQRRAARTRSHIQGTANRPRLSVNISNRHVTAQIIDDVAGRTLAYVTTVGADKKGSLADKCAWAGEQVAKAGKKNKVKEVVFDRGGRRYHRRMTALADAARKEGLEF